MRRKIKKAVAGVLSLCMTAALDIAVPVSSNAQFAEINETFEDVTVGTLPSQYHANFTDGTVSVESYLGSKCIAVSKDNDGAMSTVKRSFSRISDVGAEFIFDFSQQSVKSNGTTVFALLSGSDEIVKIETNAGNISYKNSDGTHEVLVSEYQANRWYSFTVNADLAKGTVTVKADNKTVMIDKSFTSASSYCDAICFYTRSSPGFAVDNIEIRTLNKPDKIVIDGSNKATVPISGENIYEYTATIFDDYGAQSDDEIVWDLSPAGVSGITFTSDGNSAKISVSEDTAYNGILKLSATLAENPTVKKTADIMLVDSIISKIEIIGETKLAYGLNDRNTFKYKYSMYDQYGLLQRKEPVIMRIKELCPEVSLDESGELTVLSPIKGEKHITLVVYYAEDKSVKAEKKLTLMDLETYKNDQARMNILCDAIENVMDYAKDIYGGTPLLASNIDLHTGQSPVYVSMTKGIKSVMSNLTQDSVLYRAFDAAAALTGRTDFSDKVDEIYQWYLDYGIDEYNMGKWGGHSYINLLTSDRFGCEGNDNTHELKNTAFYMDPFFRLDPDRAYSLVKTIWGGHIGSEARWKDLIANRHAFVDNTRGPQIAKSTAFWDIPDIFDDSNTDWVRDSTEQPFRGIGDDLSTVAAIAYKETGDELARTWAYRILNCYYKRRNPNTGIIPSMYATGRNAKGGLNPDAEDPDWWKKTHFSGDTISAIKYGDRFFNQFATDLVKQGFYDSSVLAENDTRLTEGNYFNNSDQFGTPIIHDLQIAKALGEDSYEAQEIKRLQTINLAAYIKYAWVKNTNKVRPIMADGTSLVGFKPKRNGFFGNYYDNGGTMGYTSINIDVFPSACACYDIAKHDKALSEQAGILWKYLQFFSKYYGLGKLGENDIGDRGMELNYATTASSPLLLMAVTDLYYSTENTEFLTLARRIAENMISTYYKYGIFVAQSNTGILPSQYYIVKTGAQNADKYYSLCYLEAAIRGDKDLIPEYYPFSGYVEGFFEYNYDHKIQRTYIDQTTDKDKYNPVEAEDLIIDDVIYLKPGETKKLEYQLLPDDVTNKSIVCESEDKKVVRVNKDTVSLIGVREGTANLIVCSNEFNIIKNVKVIVTEEVRDEEDN